MNKKEDFLDNSSKIRNSLPVIYVEGETLAETLHKSIVACYQNGIRIETPKHSKNSSLGFDGYIVTKTFNPQKEPKILIPAFYDSELGAVQYILEVTHGIHNHWKKDPNNPNDTRWGYTYNERIANQLPFVFKRIEKDFKNKGRISGRDYFFATWKPEEDTILEQEDPPCWQNGQLRFIKDGEGYKMDYITYWRSRDQIKAWNQNNIAQVKLMELFAKKISNMLNIPIEPGAYIDTSASLHIYGLYLDRDNLETTLKDLAETKNPERYWMSLEDFVGGKEEEQRFKRILAAQLDAEKKGFGQCLPEAELEKKGYNIKNISYPEDWDSWPKEWDKEV